MNSYLGINIDTLKKKNAYYIAKEISSQPEVWINTYKLFLNTRKDIHGYLNNIYQENKISIILTGAGTSAFIGKVLEGPFQELNRKTVRAIATTDLVTHPELYLQNDTPTLLISFARSGNSPESLKAIEIADNLCNNIHHLIITCNEQGELVQRNNKQNSFVFLLPPEANDQSLAMTSSFTSMLLAGMLIAAIDSKIDFNTELELLQAYAKRILNDYVKPLKQVASLAFERAVFLGSGLFKGVAEESHLKLQELSDGRIICKHDTFLGFRHGPKAVIDKKSLLIFHFSNNSYSQQYEKDLVQSINNGTKGMYRIGIMEKRIDVDLDLKIVLGNEERKINEMLLAIVTVLPSQILGFLKSLDIGLAPDSPSISNTITRVVQGVKLYPYISNKMNYV